MQELIEELRKIAAGDLSNIDTRFDCGLCHHIRQTTDKPVHNLFVESLKTWPHYSGDITYPVPLPESGLTAFEAYWSSIPKWKGEYLKLRMDLARHFADFLEARCQEQDT